MSLAHIGMVLMAAVAMWACWRFQPGFITQAQARATARELHDERNRAQATALRLSIEVDRLERRLRRGPPAGGDR